MARGRLVYVRAQRDPDIPSQKGTKWSDAKRMETLAAVLATGSTVLASSMTGVNTETIKAWKRQDWWKEAIQELQEEENTKLAKRIDKLIGKTLEQVEDRIENGDVFLDPNTGEQRRVPAKLRDIQRASTDLLTRRQAMIDKIKPKEQKQQGFTADHLVQLANAFAKMATGKEPNEKVRPVHEGEFVEIYKESGYEVPEHAISKERET